jgi:hypothetical protein
MRKILLIIATGLLFYSCNQAEKETADKIYFNARSGQVIQQMHGLMQLQ